MGDDVKVNKITVKVRELSIEEMTTGCLDANSYKQYARGQGYAHIEVLNWTSSAGDWSFIVSKDGEEWFLMWQTNEYPRRGFSHAIDEGNPYYGTPEEVFKQLEV